MIQSVRCGWILDWGEMSALQIDQFDPFLHGCGFCAGMIDIAMILIIDYDHVSDCLDALISGRFCFDSPTHPPYGGGNARDISFDTQ